IFKVTRQTFGSILNVILSKDGASTSLNCRPIDTRIQEALKQYLVEYMQVIRFRNNISLLKRFTEFKDNPQLTQDQIKGLPTPLRDLIAYNMNSSVMSARASLPPTLDRALSYVEKRCNQPDEKKAGSFSERLPNNGPIGPFPCPYMLRRHEQILGAIAMLDRVHRISNSFDKNKSKLTGLNVVTLQDLIII
ncbi:MAG TPA: hypothetical protein VLK82_03370, partial [Candidatus Tectomicrobia bacterium]|nr:hypothetical protein [Candidatus Tectomicrobia bacterium]